MSQLRSEPPQLFHMTSIRAVAALWVVMLHFSSSNLQINEHIKSFIGKGYLAVDFFFILSGFILTMVYSNHFQQTSRREYGRYLLYRFARIYPLHLAMLLLFVIMEAARSHSIFLSVTAASADRTIWEFAKAVLLVNAWGTGYSPWNYPSWSVSCEAFVYILFPLVLVFYRNNRRKGYDLLFAIFCLVALSIIAKSQELHTFDLSSRLSVTRTFLEFTCGMAICFFLKDQNTRNNGWYISLGLAAFFLAIMFQSQDLIIVTLIATLVGLLANDKGQWSRALAWRPFVYLGEISYGIYLSHALVLELRAPVLESWGIANPSGSWADIIITLSAIIAFSALLYHTVEVPLRQRIRSAAKSSAFASTTSRVVAAFSSAKGISAVIATLFLMTVSHQNAQKVFHARILAPQHTDGVWVGRYFKSTDFSGTPIIVENDTPDYDWKGGRPAAIWLKDKFSVEWEACAVVEDDAELVFSVTSDDGSFVYVNEQLILDNGGIHGAQTISTKMKLGKGAHKIKVRYFEEGGDALIAFKLQTAEGNTPKMRASCPDADDAR